MACGSDGNLLLLLDVLPQNLHLGSLANIKLICGIFFFFLTGILNDILQFESLQLIQLGTRKTASVHRQAHQLLVIDNGQVVRLYHQSFQLFLCLGICQTGCPCLLRNDDSMQHVTVLGNGYFFYIPVIFLQLVFQLGRLDVLAVTQHNNLLAAACNVDTSQFIQVT